MPNINTVSDFQQALDNGPYAWPGGYPLYFITNDGAALSFAAAKECKDQIASAIADRGDNGWRVVAIEVNWEDAELFCGHTGKRIESAYAED
jgi:hypothetical protein